MATKSKLPLWYNNNIGWEETRVWESGNMVGWERTQRKPERRPIHQNRDPNSFAEYHDSIDYMEDCIEIDRGGNPDFYYVAERHIPLENRLKRIAYVATRLVEFRIKKYEKHYEAQINKLKEEREQYISQEVDRYNKVMKAVKTIDCALNDKDENEYREDELIW